MTCDDYLAEEEGFEPSLPAKGKTVFETAAFNHSATPPHTGAQLCRSEAARALRR